MRCFFAQSLQKTGKGDGGFLEQKYRVVIAEGWDEMRECMESAIRSSEKYELAAMFPNAEKIPKYCEEKQVDILVVEDFPRKSVDGIQVACEIKKRWPSIRTLIVTNMYDGILEKRVREARLDGLWQKDYNERGFLQKLDILTKGGMVYGWNA